MFQRMFQESSHLVNLFTQIDPQHELYFICFSHMLKNWIKTSVNIIPYCVSSICKTYRNNWSKKNIWKSSLLLISHVNSIYALICPSAPLFYHLFFFSDIFECCALPNYKHSFSRNTLQCHVY